MNITSITFNNFRCFGEYHLQFKPAVNLLFGVNGCGKTSILRGLKIAMSSFFQVFPIVTLVLLESLMMTL